MEVIYVDSLFFFDLLTDYLLCLLTARFCSLRIQRMRYLLSAVIGAAYSVAVFLPGLRWLGLVPCRIAAAGFMGLAAFGEEDRLLRCILAYIALSATCGGLMYALGLDRGNVELWKLTGLFLICYVFLSLLTLARSRLSGIQFVEGEVVFRGISYTFRAMVDTGNRLRDPVTGGKVLLLSPGVMEGALGEMTQIEDPVEFLSAAGRCESLCTVFRLIPFSSVGGCGMLPVFIPDKVRINGREGSVYSVAISSKAAGDGFNAII